jgi:hypothetical protein
LATLFSSPLVIISSKKVLKKFFIYYLLNGACIIQKEKLNPEGDNGDIFNTVSTEVVREKSLRPPRYTGGDDCENYH